jgi:septum formation protein
MPPTASPQASSLKFGKVAEKIRRCGKHDRREVKIAKQIKESARENGETTPKVVRKLVSESPQSSPIPSPRSSPNSSPKSASSSRNSSPKSDALLSKLNNETLLITCDQIILCNGNILEKPKTYEEAYNFFKEYSNNKVTIINGIVLLHYPSIHKISNTDISTIYFNNISDTNIHKIIANNNIFSSAGGIIIEDLYLYNVIKDINGSISSIMGLNYNLLINMINNIVLLKK